MAAIQALADPVRRAGLRLALAWGATPSMAMLPCAAAAQAGYSLGIVPYFSPSRLEEIYAPAAADLARSIGRPVSFRTATSFDRYFLQLTSNGA